MSIAAVEAVHLPSHDKDRREVLAALDPKHARQSSVVLDYDGWLDDECVETGYFRARLRCDMTDRGDGLTCVAIIDVDGSECRASAERTATNYRLLAIRFSRHDDDSPALYVPDHRNAVTDALEAAAIVWLEETTDGQRLIDIARSEIPALDEREWIA